MLPHLTGKRPWFAFLVHPRNQEDLLRYAPLKLLRDYSANDAEFFEKAYTLPPLIGGEFVFGCRPARGELISVMRKPQDMARPLARRWVKECVDLALRRGVHVIGLGALTAPATGSGITLLDNLPKGVTLTNGNAYTAAVARTNVVEAVKKARLTNPRVAVVGCTGSVGFAASHLLAREGIDLILIGRKIDKVKRLFGSPSARWTFSDNLAEVKLAQIILVLTNAESAKLHPELLEPGTIVIDVAQPANIGIEQYNTFRTHDIFVAEGGLVIIPGYASTFNFGLPEPTCTFACLAETYLFASSGITNHSVGRPPMEFALEIEQLADECGLLIRPLDL